MLLAVAGFIAATAVVALTSSVLRSQPAVDPMQVAATRDTGLENTLRAMRVAAGMGDWEGFCRYVDVPALRSSMREIARGGLVDAQKKGEAGVIDSALGDLLVGILLEKYVTDQTLPQIMRAFTFALALSGDGAEGDVNLKRAAYFVGPDLFVMGGANTDKGGGAYIVFRKDRDAGWRLTGLTNRKP